MSNSLYLIHKPSYDSSNNDVCGDGGIVSAGNVNLISSGLKRSI